MRYALISKDHEYAMQGRSGVQRGLVLDVDDSEKRTLVQLRYVDTEDGGRMINIGSPKWYPCNRFIRTWAEQEEINRRVNDAASRRDDAVLRVAVALNVDPARVVIGRRGSVTVPLDALEQALSTLDVDWDQRREAV